MLSLQGPADELDAMLVELPPSLFRVREMDLARCDPQPRGYGCAGFEVWPELAPSSLALRDDRRDLTCGRGVRFEADDEGGGLVTKQVVPPALPAVSASHSFVEVHAVREFRSQGHVNMGEMGMFHRPKIVSDLGPQA
ncbi:MAG: hypothetical protein AB1714_09725 [Acidobacteriota bacterium]